MTINVSCTRLVHSYPANGVDEAIVERLWDQFQLNVKPKSLGNYNMTFDTYYRCFVGLPDRSRPYYQKLFNKMDKDGDGLLSFAEFTSVIMFCQLPPNKQHASMFI